MPEYNVVAGSGFFKINIWVIKFQFDNLRVSCPMILFVGLNCNEILRYVPKLISFISMAYLGYWILSFPQKAGLGNYLKCIQSKT